MPALAKLRSRIKSDLAWDANYVGNLKDCVRISTIIPLIHTTCKMGLFVDLLLESKAILEPSNDSSARNAATAIDEDRAGLGRCLYFYAGRAYPVSGGVALVLASESENGHTGSTTPFDSGGMIRGYIHPLSSQKEADRRQFIVDSTLALPVWRRWFALYLAAYFHAPVQYMIGRPCYPDPEGVFDADGNDFRAWVFEIRFHEQEQLRSRSMLRWYAQNRHVRSLERRLKSVSLSEQAVLTDIYKRGVKATDYIQEVERWVREEVFHRKTSKSSTI